MRKDTGSQNQIYMHFLALLSGGITTLKSYNNEVILLYCITVEFECKTLTHIISDPCSSSDLCFAVDPSCLPLSGSLNEIARGIFLEEHLSLK